MGTNGKNVRYRVPDPLAVVTDELLMEHIPAASRVVDLGCGDGRLLQKLRDQKNCQVLGVELDRQQIVKATHRGVPVIHADLDRGLAEFPSKSFDAAVLSQTLQEVKRPKDVLQEMMRIARRALVVVPNFGHWMVRLQVFRQGRAPVTSSFPYEWYETPNLHFLSMYDFRDLCDKLGVRIVRELPIIGRRAVDRAWLANLRATSALYVLEDGSAQSPNPQPSDACATAATPHG